MRLLACLLILAGACGDDDASTPDAAALDGALDRDFGPAPTCDAPAPADSSSCAPLATDYAPGAEDTWDACVSDDGEYHRVQESISSIARVGAFEAIADLLFDPAAPPTSDDFLAARMLYQEEEGLDSRVARRYDPRFEVPEGTDCTQPGVPEEFPDYCVGPATLQPLILGGLNQGIAAADPTAAARVEAGLLWLLYASTNKEAYTCTTAAKDCDSSYAYYTGGEAARGGLGFARYVAEAAPVAHDRAWDGLLALRCWRDLDDAETATDLETRDLARAQLDTAITYGFAQILRARLGAMCDAGDGEVAAYHWAFVRIAAPALYATLGASERATVEAQVALDDPGAVDVAAFAAALDAYDCP